MEIIKKLNFVTAKKFFGKLFLINFAIGVVISIVFRTKPDAARANASDEMMTRSDAGVLTAQRALTLVALLALAVGTLAFNLNVGFVAISAAVVLAIAFPAAQKGAVEKAAWSTVLLICGVITYVAVLQKAGTVDWIGEGAAHMGSPLLAVLLLCYVAGIVSAFASSVGVLGATIPLAVPLLAQGHLSAVGVVAAIAVATTIVDASPFSTNGALLLANTKPVEREAVFKRLLIYGGVMTVFGPFLAWLFLALPGW